MLQIYPFFQTFEIGDRQYFILIFLNQFDEISDKDDDSGSVIKPKVFIIDGGLEEFIEGTVVKQHGGITRSFEFILIVFSRYLTHYTLT